MPADTPSPPPVDRIVESIWQDERPYLVGLASRMLGNASDAEDVVQEAFRRLLGVEIDTIDEVRGWLTVAVRRLCLNRLQSAYARRESAAGAAPPEPLPAGLQPIDPSDRVTLDDQVQLALAVVLDRLTPAERTAFVLHDVFGLPFTEVAEMVGRTPVACRQLASRARRAIRSGPPAARSGTTIADDRSLVAERFIAACAGGDISDLLAVLDPDIVGEAKLLGGRLLSRVEGARQVATTALKILGQSETTLLPIPFEDETGIVAITRGRVRAVMQLGTAGGRIQHIHAFVIPPKRPTR